MTPTIIDLDVRRQNFLGRFLPSGPAKNKAEIFEAVAGKRCLELTHGFNSKEPGIRKAYGEIIDGMRRYGILEHYDTIIQDFWPGGSTVGYYLAEMKAEGVLMKGAGDHIREALKGPRGYPWMSLDKVMHSAGNRVGCDMNRKGDVPIRHMLMCAAAIDDDAICYPKGEFHAAVGSISGKALVFYSKGDGVLGKAYKLAKFDNALGLTGPQKSLEAPSTVVPVDANAWIREHSEFRHRPEFYAEWKKLLG